MNRTPPSPFPLMACGDGGVLKITVCKEHTTLSDKFLDKHLSWYQEIVEKIPGEKIFRSPTETNIQCTNPVHDDIHPSMGVDLCQNGQGPKINIICRSGGLA